MWGFLPALFIPFLPEPFETPKAIFFLTSTSILLLMTCWNWARYDANIKARLFCFPEASLANKRLIKTVILWTGIVLIASFRHGNDVIGYWNYFPADTWLLNLALVGFFLVLISNFSGIHDVSLLINTLLIGSVPVVFYSIIQIFYLDPFTWETDANSPMLSTLGRSTYVGGYMAAIAPFLVYKGRMAVKGRIFWFFTWGVLSILTLFTFSRSAFFIFVVSSFLWIVFSGHRRIRIGIFSLFLLAWLGVFFQTRWKYTILPQEPLWLQFETPSSSNQTLSILWETAFGQRIHIWSEVWPLWLRHPWLGFGFGAFPKLFASESHPALMQIGLSPVTILHPHNIWLNLLISAGLIGLITFLLILFETLRHIWRLVKTSDKRKKLLASTIGTSMLTIVFLGLWNPLILIHWMIFWGEIAMVVLLDNNIQ